MGYCLDVREAGRYTKEEADEICRQAHFGEEFPPEVAILASEALASDPLADEQSHADRLASLLEEWQKMAVKHGLENLGYCTFEELDAKTAALIKVHLLRRSPKGKIGA